MKKSADEESSDEYNKFQWMQLAESLEENSRGQKKTVKKREAKNVNNILSYLSTLSVSNDGKIYNNICLFINLT